MPSSTHAARPSRIRSCESSLGILGQLHRRKALLRVEIILARLVHDAEIPFLAGILILTNLMELPQFEVLRPFCVDADNILTSWFAHALLQEAFDLELLPPETVRFIPVYLGTADCPIPKTNGRRSLEPPPASRTELRLQASPLSHRCSLRDELDLADLPDDLEVHRLRPLTLADTFTSVR
jgi:hypothetical protein